LGVIVASKHDKKPGKKADSKKSSKDAAKAADKQQRKAVDKKARESRAAAKEVQKATAKKAKKKHAPAPKTHNEPTAKVTARLTPPISRKGVAPPVTDPTPFAVPALALPATPSPSPTTGATPILVPNESWTVTALRARARALAIPGYSRMTKAELLDRLIVT